MLTLYMKTQGLFQVVSFLRRRLFRPSQVLLHPTCYWATSLMTYITRKYQIISGTYDLNQKIFIGMYFNLTLQELTKIMLHRKAKWFQTTISRSFWFLTTDFFNYLQSLDLDLVPICHGQSRYSPSHTFAIYFVDDLFHSKTNCFNINLFNVTYVYVYNNTFN